MRFKPNSAQVIRPVNPRPPMVAANNSGRSVGPQSSRSPELRTSSRRVTWCPKVPARWWFLPCTSLAMAPPTVTYLVPGVTGRNQPPPTVSDRISLSRTPASQRIRPVAESKSRKRSSLRVASRVPPLFRQLSP